MRRSLRLTRPIAVSAALLTALIVSGCAPTAEKASDPAASPSQATAATEGSTTGTGGQSQAQVCLKDNLNLLTPGKLTIGTDSPAYDPWFSNDDPTNGKGFESAVAYAVADKLGFTPDEVTWVTVPFNTSYKPGAKDFDFDINQISITPARAKVVDFSDGYYSAAQAIIALKDSPAAAATSLADLKGLKLGAQTGTTSLTAIRDVIQPTTESMVFEDTNAAKQAMMNGQVDAIVADLPSAFYITAVEIPKGQIIGQFQPTTGQTEEFGLLFEKGNSLVGCVNDALGTLKDDGTLAGIEKQWLSDTVNVPVIQ